MRRSEIRNQQLPKFPIRWRQAEDVALRKIDADTCDDRVSEDIFDIEDERAEIGIIVKGMRHDLN